MDIHHAMTVRNNPERVYEALTRQRDLEIWMDAPTIVKPEVGSTIEFQYEQGQRTLKMEIIHLEERASLMTRLKIDGGDMREIASLYPREEKNNGK